MSYDFMLGLMLFATLLLANKFAKKTYQPSETVLKNVSESELKKRFKREVKYQKALSHPNIVEIIESNLDENPLSFIMPLAICTLNDEIYSNAFEDKPELIKSALFDILAGLEYMHNRGYVHRDLKPANILKFLNEQKVTYALSDFGLISMPNGDSSQLTSSNAGGIGKLFFS